MEGPLSTMLKWVKTPPSLITDIKKPFLKSRIVKHLNNNQVLCQPVGMPIKTKQFKTNLQQCYDVANQNEFYEDMCQMNVLNEPQVLNNLVERYLKQQIFTYIGPTLIIMNPYKILPHFFSKQKMNQIRQKVLQQDLSNDFPHIYMIAGKAFLHMKHSDNKQAIVISGQSGAGKTESTKYCMQILTSLSHAQKHPIQSKILSCNPLLQAFGNSKTVRNDNSSRFGKYVQIFFGSDNTIKGANINSYLLQKSRVVSIAKGERSFHVFYALIASKKFSTKPPTHYNFLKQSSCFEANNIDDKAYFFQIQKAMNQIGFDKKQQQKIWHLLKAILDLGNIEFDDTRHRENQQSPCLIINKENLKQIIEVLQIKSLERFQQLLLFQRKNMIGNIIFKAYKKQGCIGHRNTLCKAIYHKIFDFILNKVQESLKPAKQNYMRLKQINILDIFGFENFQQNSFEQLCINFTNQKLLKLYNEYIFKKQLQILKQDGLEKDIENLKAPTNQDLINIICTNNIKAVSIFSIVNDITTQPHATNDIHIKQSIEKNVANDKIGQKYIKVNKVKNAYFTIQHSQCNVQYNVEGFRMKNLDKVNDDISQVIEGLSYINAKNQNPIAQVGKNMIKKASNAPNKTLLKKFSSQIQNLINELSTSNVHFIRCIKPNEEKKPNFPVQTYILSQIRCLGVFQTIQIRKKTFPVRRFYQEFNKEYKKIFKNLKKTQNQKNTTKQILEELKCQSNQFMLGTRRVYINERLEAQLNKMVYQFYKKQEQQIKKLQAVCRRYIFRSKVTRKTQQLIKRKQIWKKIVLKLKKEILKQGLSLIKERSKKVLEKIQNQKTQKITDIHKIKKTQTSKDSVKNELRTDQNKIMIPRNVDKHKMAMINQKFFKYSKVLIKAHSKLSLAFYFQTIKKKFGPKNNNTQDLNQTIFVQAPASKNLNPSIKQLSKNKPIGKNEPNNFVSQQQMQLNKQNKFSESFYNQESIYISEGADVIFKGNLKVPMFQKTAQALQQLKLLQTILGQKYKQLYQNENELCSPPSEDSNFQIQKCPEDIMNKIINFPIDQFFEQILRKRTGVFGMKKDYSEILTFKPRPLTKTLTQLESQDQKQALKVFKLLLKIHEQSKLDNVFKLVQNIILYCQQTSQDLKNEVFLQLIKQSNNQSQIGATRIYQTFSVFLHIYIPDEEFLYAALYLFFNKLAEKKYHEKEQQYIRYLFKKIVRKIQKPHGVGYLPIKYQIMALMSKRQISIPVYLPIGNSVLIKVQSYETFKDIKQKALQALGINTERLMPELFSFFEVVNYENTDLQESPINESTIIWDLMTYWQLAKNKYQESGVSAPSFFMMIKVKYTYQCTIDDEETIQLFYAQCYFDYSMGRIRLEFNKMCMLAACIKKIKMIEASKNQIQGCFPLWMSNVYSKDKEKMRDTMLENFNWLQKQNLGDLQTKYRFLEVCSECPMSLTYAIPTQHSIKLFLKPKRILLVQKGVLVGEYSIRQIAKWSNSEESFNFQIRRKDGSLENKTHMIMTEFAGLCTEYLNKISQLLVKFGGRSHKKGQQKILRNL